MSAQFDERAQYRLVVFGEGRGPADLVADVVIDALFARYGWEPGDAQLLVSAISVAVQQERPYAAMALPHSWGRRAVEALHDYEIGDYPKAGGGDAPV